MSEEIFGKLVKAVEGDPITNCNKCVFNNRECYSSATASAAKCSKYNRGKDVYYVEVLNHE